MLDLYQRADTSCQTLGYNIPVSRVGAPGDIDPRGCQGGFADIEVDAPSPTATPEC